MNRVTEDAIADIARMTHETNRAWCYMWGDDSQPAWDEAPEWQRRSAMSGVRFVMENPDAPPSASHDNWLRDKAAEGWRYGAVKDPERKEHPCFVPYDELPWNQRVKDELFQAVARTLLGCYGRDTI